MHHPRILLSLLILVGLIAAACGSDDSLETEEPEPTATAAEPTATPLPEPTATPADDEGGDGGASDAGDQGGEDGGDDTGSDDAGDGADGQTDGDGTDGTVDPGPPTLVVAVFTSGGFVPVEVALSAHPELVILSDGTAYRPGPQIDVFPPPLVPAIERLQLSADDVATIRDILATSSAIGPDVEFGSPTITDVATTSVTARIDGADVVVSAYALGFDDAVGGAAQDNRVELLDVLARINRIVDEASATGELSEPPALAVLTFPGLGIQEDAPSRPWPIDAVPVPHPGGADCVLLTGADLTTVWEAAADANIQSAWVIDGQTKAIAFRPVFDHEDFCRP